jgi:hypothetical protein
VNWKRIFEPQGLNWWTIVSGIGMNFVMTAFLFITIGVVWGEEMGGTWYTLIMSVCGFAIPMITAYICGRLAGERYMTYAMYPLIGYLILVVPGILFAGVFGLLMVAFGVLGAFNGANLAARRAHKKRQEIYGDLDIANPQEPEKEGK